MDGGFASNAVESGVKVGKELVIENVDGPVGNVDPQDGEPVRLLIDAHGFGLEHGHVGILRGSGPFAGATGWSRSSYAASTKTAAPCPPPTHSIARPRCLPRRCSSFNSVITSRVPLAPTGCPSAMAPP